jgi:hypothetical protein
VVAVLIDVVVEDTHHCPCRCGCNIGTISSSCCDSNFNAFDCFSLYAQTKHIYTSVLLLYKANNKLFIYLLFVDDDGVILFETKN